MLRILTTHDHLDVFFISILYVHVVSFIIEIYLMALHKKRQNGRHVIDFWENEAPGNAQLRTTRIVWRRHMTHFIRTCLDKTMQDKSCGPDKFAVCAK